MGRLSRRYWSAVYRASTPNERRDLACLVLVAVFATLAVVHYMAGAYLEKSYPQSTPFYLPADRLDGFGQPIAGAPDSAGAGVHLFGDFYQMWSITKLDSPYNSSGYLQVSNYPPLVHILLRPFILLPYDAAVAVYLMGLVVAMFLITYRAMPGTGPARLLASLVIGVFTYPFLFLLDRGNVDGIALVFVGCALLLHQRRWWLRPVLLALAAATKIYPAVYGLLLVQQRRWREFGIWCATGVVVTVGALLLFDEGLVGETRLFFDAVRDFTTATGGSGSQFVQHTTSLVSMANAFVIPGVLPEGVKAVAAVMSVVILLALAVVVARVPMRPWQSTYLLATMATVALSAAYDYRLCFFIVPLLLLIRDEAEVGGRAFVMTGLMAFVLVPKSLPILYNDVSVGPLINPPLILGIAGLVLASVRHDRRLARLKPVAEPARDKLSSTSSAPAT